MELAPDGLRRRGEAGTLPGVWLVMGWWDCPEMCNLGEEGFGERKMRSMCDLNVRGLEDVHGDNGLPMRLAGSRGSWESQL